MAQWQTIHLPKQETWVQSLGREDPLEEEMATHSSILAVIIPWTEEPGGLQSMGVSKSWTCLSAHTASINNMEVQDRTVLESSQYHSPQVFRLFGS